MRLKSLLLSLYKVISIVKRFLGECYKSLISSLDCPMFWNSAVLHLITGYVCAARKGVCRHTPFPTMIPNYAAAKFAKDARRKARRRTFVLQVPDNKADLVKLAAPCGFKYRTIFNSGGMHLLGEHSKLDNTP